jgi:hypothetical protein
VLGKCDAIAAVIAGSLSETITTLTAVLISGQRDLICRKNSACVDWSFRSCIKYASGMTGSVVNSVSLNNRADT